MNNKHITFVKERVALSLEMGLQSHQKAETKVSVPNKNTISSYKDRINNIIGQEKVCVYGIFDTNSKVAI